MNIGEAIEESTQSVFKKQTRVHLYTILSRASLEFISMTDAIMTSRFIISSYDHPKNRYVFDEKLKDLVNIYDVAM
jgi:hypothetical protein